MYYLSDAITKGAVEQCHFVSFPVLVMLSVP